MNIWQRDSSKTAKGFCWISFNYRRGFFPQHKEERKEKSSPAHLARLRGQRIIQQAVVVYTIAVIPATKSGPNATKGNVQKYAQAHAGSEKEITHAYQNQKTLVQ